MRDKVNKQSIRSLNILIAFCAQIYKFFLLNGIGYVRQVYALTATGVGFRVIWPQRLCTCVLW